MSHRPFPSSQNLPASTSESADRQIVHLDGHHPNTPTYIRDQSLDQVSIYDAIFIDPQHHICQDVIDIKKKESRWARAKSIAGKVFRQVWDNLNGVVLFVLTTVALTSDAVVTTLNNYFYNIEETGINDDLSVSFFDIVPAWVIFCIALSFFIFKNKKTSEKTSLMDRTHTKAPSFWLKFDQVVFRLSGVFFGWVTACVLAIYINGVLYSVNTEQAIREFRLHQEQYLSDVEENASCDVREARFRTHYQMITDNGRVADGTMAFLLAEASATNFSSSGCWSPQQYMSFHQQISDDYYANKELSNQSRNIIKNIAWLPDTVAIDLSAGLNNYVAPRLSPQTEYFCRRIVGVYSQHTFSEIVNQDSGVGWASILRHIEASCDEFHQDQEFTWTNENMEETAQNLTRITQERLNRQLNNGYGQNSSAN